MRKVVFMIDGWFMRKRIYALKAFHYDGPSIRDYCKSHLRENDYVYRIFYYDTESLEAIGHNPITREMVNFGETPTAVAQKKLFESIKHTPNFALRLGSTMWRNKAWVLNPDKLKALLKKEISIDDITEYDVFPHIEQKAVDMRIGLDIALIAIKKTCRSINYHNR